jgi:CTP:molybdopterin cytidylyltransferase MocA
VGGIPLSFCVFEPSSLLTAQIQQALRAHANALQIFVFFADDPKVGVKTIKIYAERMRNEGVSRAIMVVQVRQRFRTSK